MDFTEWLKAVGLNLKFDGNIYPRDSNGWINVYLVFGEKTVRCSDTDGYGSLFGRSGNSPNNQYNGGFPSIDASIRSLVDAINISTKNGRILSVEDEGWWCNPPENLKYNPRSLSNPAKRTK